MAESKEGQTIAFPQYLPTKTTQADFSGGLNAVAAPHLIGPNEVQSGTNVDFSYEWGGSPCRRGNITYIQDANAGAVANNIQAIARAYQLNTGTWNDNAIPWFAASDNGLTYTGSGTASEGHPMSMGTVAGYNGGAQSQVFPAITQYGSYIYVANGTSAFRYNGTSTLDWLMPKPDTPTVSFVQQGTFSGTGASAGPFVGFAGTWTATEGTVVSTSTSFYFGNAGGVIVSTCTTGTGSRLCLVATTGVQQNWENTVVFITNPSGSTVTVGAGTYTVGGDIDFHQGWPSGDISGATGSYVGTATVTQTLSIGAYGSDYILLGLSDQQTVVTVQRDLSIGDATFTNYWHSETTPTQLSDATTDPLSLLLAAQGTAVFDQQTQAINISRASSPSPSRRNVPQPLPVFRKTAGKTSTGTVVSPWAVARTDYQFIGTLPSPDFTNIKAIRLIFEFNTTGKQIAVGGCATYGAQGWCLNDQALGISYFQTYARVENGVIVAEGAPSNPSTPTKAQYAYATIVCTSNTNTTAGITHRVFYRNGGLLQDAYRVGSCSIVSGTATIYDYNMPDMQVVGRPALKRFLWSQWPDPSDTIPPIRGVNCVSEAWQDRVFIGYQEHLYWSYPGQPTQINNLTKTTVGDLGDMVQAIIPYGNLVVVKQNSVWEMQGTIFEGTNANFSISKTASRRGCAAPKTCVKTPAGIFLFSYDGCSVYRSGYGIDQDLTWVYDKIGDLWKGTGTNDPAVVKNRIPALNQATIYNACAAYRDQKIYLAVPTGSNTLPDTMFILDLAHQKVWMHQYPFKINSLFWDKVQNRLMAGTDKGTVQQLEISSVDYLPTNTPQNIVWNVKTRSWSTPTDIIFENVQVEQTGTMSITPFVDGNIATIGTINNGGAKAWSPITFGGTVGDRLELYFSGTNGIGQTTELNQLQWDMIPLSPKVLFFQTDDITIPSENYIKTWLVEVDCIGTATVTATLAINGTNAVLANGGTSTALTFSGTGRRLFEVSLANPTTAKTVRAFYKSTTGFRYYDTQFEFEPKPFEKLRWLVTYKKIGGVTQADMARFYAMDIEGTLTATVTSTWIIDGVAFTTDTFTISAANAGETSGVGRMYADQIPFPPGGRGYLFQQQLSSSQPFRVWKAHVDIDRIGVKGLSRVTLAGTPQAQ